MRMRDHNNWLVKKTPSVLIEGHTENTALYEKREGVAAYCKNWEERTERLSFVSERGRAICQGNKNDHH
jgi:hypothetical protein